MADVVHCELELTPSAPAEAAEWVRGRVDVSEPGAAGVAWALTAAVLETEPTRLRVAIGRAEGRTRIIAYGSSRVGPSALTQGGLLDVETHADRYGTTRDGHGLFADLAEVIATDACDLEVTPVAPAVAGRWVRRRAHESGADSVAMALTAAVLTTSPTGLLIRITRYAARVRINVYGSSPVRESALTLGGLRALQEHADRHGIHPGGCGLWAEITR